MSSEPKWLPGGDAFAYDADTKHVGIFSMVTRRSMVLPEPVGEPYLTSFRFVVADRVFVAAVLKGGIGTELVGLGWPSLREEVRFRLPGGIVDLASSGGETFYAGRAPRGYGRQDALLEMNLREGQPRYRGFVRDRAIRYPLFNNEGLAFVSFHESSDLWSRGAAGELTQLTHDGKMVSGARCGPDFVVARYVGEDISLFRLDREGRVLYRLTNGSFDDSPTCSPDGTAWYFARWGESAGVFGCVTGASCLRLMDGMAVSVAASPNGQRVAATLITERGPFVRWIRNTGGEAHDVAPSETFCASGWSSDRTLWISRRKLGRLLWTEVVADTGEETGKTAPAAKECTDGLQDPLSPVNPDVRIVVRRTSEIRLLPREVLAP
jgi:hypothetical protein